ncbi:DUF1513 domain-containing protein [Photobacterium angustum]|nr:DUF1513 domain-containing protein [Photobacterium angustum]
MQPMEINLTRRKLLGYALSSASTLPFISLTGCDVNARHGASAQSHRQPKLIGCSRTAAGKFAAVVADLSGNPLLKIMLPARGHGIALQRNGSLTAVFSRRPGQYVQVFDHQSGKEWSLRAADPNRYFYGHGVFSDDGQYLYTTEGESATSRGIIGVYEVKQGLPKVAEFSGFGIGPHEVIWADNNTLAVGVGGVHTQGRTPLNLDSMQPALVYLDKSRGEIVDQAELADKRLSIRHLSLMDNGGIACGQQYRGEPEHAAPLVATHQRGQALHSLLAEDEEWLRFNHYIASIGTIDGYLLATSPRGNCYGIWDQSTRELVEVKPLVDASGVAMLNNHWIVGSGAGKILSIDTRFKKTSKQSAIMWDNHWALSAV